MGQKANPISLRLQSTTRNFESCWYSKYFYSELLIGDLRIREYMDSLLKQIEYPRARLFLQSFQKKIHLFLFFCSPQKIRQLRAKNLKFKFLNLKKRKKGESTTPKFLSTKGVNHTTLTQSDNKEEVAKSFFLQYHLLLTYLYQRDSRRDGTFFLLPLKKKLNDFLHYPQKKGDSIVNQNLSRPSTISPVGSGIGKSTILKVFSNGSLTLSKGEKDIIPSKMEGSENRYIYRKHVENILSKQYQMETVLTPLKVHSDFRSALFLAEEIQYYIERRVPFRQIKKKILQELPFLSYIKGVRIQCSGRVGGRSKKAQRAKTESFKYGQTSLHVFSNSIDFASKHALTPFGAIGLKVWICYR